MMWGEGEVRRDYGVKFPCAVCDRDVGSNSILCGTCGRWTHKKCSREIAGEGERGCEKVEVEPGMFLERVSKFCYL